MSTQYQVIALLLNSLQGKNAVDAAKECGVQHLVYSGLENVKESCGYSVACFDGKGRVEEYLRSCGLEYTIVRLSFYMENLLTMFPPKRQDDGWYHLGTISLLKCFSRKLR